MPLFVGSALARAAATVPHRHAATLGDRAVTFADLDAQAHRAARTLRARGVGRGDLVALLGPTDLAALPWFAGAARVGAVFAPVGEHLAEAELLAVVRHLRPRLVLALPGSHEAGAAAAADVDADLGAVGGPGPGEDLDAIAQRSGADPVEPPAGMDEDDPHIAYLTSGSTGTPKAVLVSHRASRLRASAGGGTVAMGMRGPGGLVNSFPLSHYGGWHYVMEAWELMVPSHLVARARGDELTHAVARWGATGLYCIPAVWERVLDPAYEGVDLSSLRHADTGTSSFGADLVDRIKRRLPGTTTSVLYGSTEMGRMAGLPDHELARHGSVGWAAWPGELRVAPDGEVLGRSPTMMNGYLRQPEATAAAFVDGWYRTGDLGRLDQDGALSLTGRATEMIRSGGEWVAPAEVESALRSHPAVADVAVVGLPDDRWGELVCAVVVPPPGVPPPTVAELRGHLDGRLASHKHPREVRRLAVLPRTRGTGQVQRQRVRAQVLAAAAERPRSLDRG